MPKHNYSLRQGEDDSAKYLNPITTMAAILLSHPVEGVEEYAMEILISVSKIHKLLTDKPLEIVADKFGKWG